VVDTVMVMAVRPSVGGEALTAPQGQTLHRLAGSVNVWLRVSLVWVVVQGLACTSAGVSPNTARITPDELLAGATLGVAPAAPTSIAEEADMLAVSAEMRAFLDKHVNRKGSDSLKLHQLVSAIIEEGTFGLEYDDKTRTASEAFHARRGNCLSFSTLFLAMARDVGLNVHFQEVDVPPDWTLDKDTYVLNQHVNVYVDLGQAGVRVVDFNIGDFKSSYEMRTIPDAWARAHYYNNIGVERMQVDDIASALVCFRRAIADGEGRFSPAWTNLGTLYLRNGQPADAEAAYLQALKANGSDLVAMSDLARLYERRGDRERAAAYQKRVIEHRYLNPYYRFELARQAYSGKDYDAAIGHLKYAIRKRPKEDQFYFLLGACYLEKGNKRAAERWLAKAQEVAGTDALKRRYSGKIDVLLRGTTNNRP
jgi:Tetratricopeptide repeat/Transglutaminase-like superfamily